MHPFCKFMSKFSGEIKITHDTETNSPAIPIIKPTIMTRPTQTTTPSNNFLILSFYQVKFAAKFIDPSL